MNNLRTLVVNLYKDNILVTRLRDFRTTLFTNNNIKVVIHMHTFLTDWKRRLVFVLQVEFQSVPFTL